MRTLKNGMMIVLAVALAGCSDDSRERDERDADVECVDDDQCVDDDLCNGLERCVDGECIEGEPVECDDEIDCTEDTCVPEDGCQNVPNHQNCGEGEICGPSGCVEGGECLDDDECDDGSFCNGAETCVEGRCTGGEPPACDDGIDCTADRCDEEAEECIAAPDASLCDDGSFCNGAEICDPEAGCLPGDAPNCNDERDCTDDECSTERNECVFTPVDRDGDGELATECGGADCNDTDATIAPGAEELCDGEDNDCDGEIDEDVDVEECCAPGDSLPCGLSVGLCEPGTRWCMDERAWGECEGAVDPAEEICDGEDNDCDTIIDEELGTTNCGLGECEHTIENCIDGVKQTCDPLEGSSFEICDGLDNDCDGLEDNGDEPLGCEDTEGCCGGACIDLFSDAENCGACGHVCDLDHVAEHTCEMGYCQVGECEDGFSDCDEDPENGCEASITSDALNCTNCGIECREPAMCEEGVCTDGVLGFTFVPEYRNCHLLRGVVYDVDPATVIVAVYIRVGGWWTKPYWASPDTIVHPDGSWSCNVCTGGSDSRATEMMAFLLPADVSPPLMRGGRSLPASLFEDALGIVAVRRRP